MKKQLVLLAIGAAVAGTAGAQNAGPEIYGRVNTSIEVQKLTGVADSTVMQNNASRWGVRGKEDLGGGLSAFYKLESGFASDTGKLGGDGGIFNREAYFGVSSGYGTLRAGKILTAVYLASADYVSMHNHDTGTSSDALFGFAATGGMNNNTVAYETPSIAGGTFEISHSFATAGQEQPGSKNVVNTQIAYNTVQGPLHIGAGYAVNEDKRGATVGKDETAVVRALYMAGPLAVGGYYEHSKLQVGTGRHTRNNFRLAGMYAVGNSEFHANAGIADSFSGLSDTGARQWTVAYNYNLSKRTKLYAFYTEVDQDSKTNYYLGSKAGDKFSSLAVGMRHNF